MSRTDQYIGLTTRAKNFMKSLGDEVKTEKFVLVDSDGTLCGETIYGTKWTSYYDNGKIKEEFVETVQTTPWSSGPMYFTHLKRIFHYKENNGTYGDDFYFSWFADPSLKDTGQEFDLDIGGYWV